MFSRTPPASMSSSTVPATASIEGRGRRGAGTAGRRGRSAATAARLIDDRADALWAPVQARVRVAAHAGAGAQADHHVPAPVVALSARATPARFSVPRRARRPARRRAAAVALRRPRPCLAARRRPRGPLWAAGAAAHPVRLAMGECARGRVRPAAPPAPLATARGGLTRGPARSLTAHVRRLRPGSRSWPLPRPSHTAADTGPATALPAYARPQITPLSPRPRQRQDHETSRPRITRESGPPKRVSRSASIKPPRSAGHRDAPQPVGCLRGLGSPRWHEGAGHRGGTAGSGNQPRPG